MKKQKVAWKHWLAMSLSLIIVVSSSLSVFAENEINSEQTAISVPASEELPVDSEEENDDLEDEPEETEELPGGDSEETDPPEVDPEEEELKENTEETDSLEEETEEIEADPNANAVKRNIRRAVSEESNIARAGETEYSSLEEAVENAGWGETVTLLKDIELQKSLTIAESQNIVLDLAGFAITVPNPDKPEKVFCNSSTFQVQ